MHVLGFPLEIIISGVASSAKPNGTFCIHLGIGAASPANIIWNGNELGLNQYLHLASLNFTSELVVCPGHKLPACHLSPFCPCLLRLTY